jgi:NAD(P)-dependent dehydrogenase (short-subunit alcohol dehydrogenase family)
VDGDNQARTGDHQFDRATAPERTVRNWKIVPTAGRSESFALLDEGGTVVLGVDLDESLAAALDTIDLLINNAGIGFAVPIQEVPLDDVPRAKELNPCGTAWMVPGLLSALMDPGQSR